MHTQSLSSIVSMSNNLKSTWPRMSEEAKVRKLLLLEGLCESLRSTVRPPPSYGEWSRDRLAAVLLDVRADASKKGRINAAARAAAHRRAGSSKQ